MPIFLRGHAFTQIVENLHVRPAFFRRINHLGTSEDIAVTNTVMTDIIEFELAGNGKNDVRHGCRRSHKQIGDCNKVEVHKSLIRLTAVGIG